MAFHSIRLSGKPLEYFKPINYSFVQTQKSVLAKHLGLAKKAPNEKLAAGILSFDVAPASFSIGSAAFIRMTGINKIDVSMKEHAEKGEMIDEALNSVLGKEGLITYFDSKINRFWILRAADTDGSIQAPIIPLHKTATPKPEEKQNKTIEAKKLDLVKPAVIPTPAKEKRTVSQMLEHTLKAAAAARKPASEINLSTPKIEAMRKQLEILFANADKKFLETLIWMLSLKIASESFETTNPKELFADFWEEDDPNKEKAKAFVGQLRKRSNAIRAENVQGEQYDAYMACVELAFDLKKFIQ